MRICGSNHGPTLLLVCQRPPLKQGERPLGFRDQQEVQTYETLRLQEGLSCKMRSASKPVQKVAPGRGGFLPALAQRRIRLRVEKHMNN